MMKKTIWLMMFLVMIVLIPRVMAEVSQPILNESIGYILTFSGASCPNYPCNESINITVPNSITLVQAVFNWSLTAGVGEHNISTISIDFSGDGTIECSFINVSVGAPDSDNVIRYCNFTQIPELVDNNIGIHNLSIKHIIVNKSTAVLSTLTAGVSLRYLPYIINYDTENVLESSLQDFDITITNLTNTTAIDIAFFYNGTLFEFGTTTKYPSYTAFNYSFNIPIIITPANIYNYTFYFDYNHTFPARNETRTSETYNQSVYNIKVGNCSGFDFPSDTFALNITFYDLKEEIVDVDYEATAFYGLTHEQLNQNFSFENPHINNVSYCIYPDFASIQVDQQNRWYDGVNYYDYFLFNNTFNNVTQIIKLYTQNNSQTTQVLFTVQDTNTDPIPNAYIHILKYNVGTGSYTIQEILKTDSQGQAIGNIVLFNDYYNFLVYFNGMLVYTEQAVKLITSTRTFTIDLEGVGWIDDFEVAFGVNYNLYFNNASNNFVFTWSDPTSASHFGCLKVDVNNNSGKFTISDTCIESASGTIVYTISSYNGSTFTATGYLKFEINIVLKVIQQVYAAARDFFFKEMPLLSLFISMIIIIALFCIGLPHPAISLSLMGLGLIITYILGLFTVTPIFLGGIIFLIMLQLYLASKK